MKIVVVGGGFAGFAAAVALQERRHQVTLLERRGVLGGRASSSRDAVTGEDVDNGTHLMLGAYGATLDLLRRCGAGDLLAFQDDLRLEWVDDRGVTTLACPPLPAPLHLLAGLFGLRLPLAVKLQAARLGLAVRLGRRPDGLTLAQYFERCGQGEAARRLLWDPLALAVLNERPETAAAVLFHRVYREAFLSRREASRLVFLRCGWSTLFARIRRYFEDRGGIVRAATRAEGLLVEQARVAGVRCAARPRERDAITAGTAAGRLVVPADAVVLAVPPPALVSLLPERWRAEPPFAALREFRGAPIVSVELWLDRVVVDRSFVGLRDSELEWVFDKGRLFGRSGTPQHLAFIVSAAYRSAPKPNSELVAAAEAVLRRYFPAMSAATVQRALVLRDPAATFASTPGLEAERPGPRTPIGGLFLAGDWTGTGLPATIEGAARSGVAAAAEVQAFACGS
jgi:squalene-associated FAD-dependent desaturase